jgi:hypothetical protein
MEQEILATGARIIASIRDVIWIMDMMGLMISSELELMMDYQVLGLGAISAGMKFNSLTKSMSHFLTSAMEFLLYTMMY